MVFPTVYETLVAMEVDELIRENEGSHEPLDAPNYEGLSTLEIAYKEDARRRYNKVTTSIKVVK